MMTQDMDSFVEQIAELTKRRDPRTPVRRWFLASTGSTAAPFLSRVADALRRTTRSVIYFDLPSGQFDPAEHLLGQLCQGLETSQLPRASFSPNYPIHKRIAWITRPLASKASAPFLLLNIPGSWLRPVWDPRRTLPDTSRNILEALLEHTGFDAVVISTRKPGWLGKLIGGFPEPLPEAAARPDFLLDERRWKSASVVAQRLASALGEASTILPHHLERGVASSVLGWPDSQVATVLLGATPESDLVKMMRLKLQGKPEWQRALGRLVLPRFPVPRELLDHLAVPMSETQRAFADCLIHEEHGEAKADEVIRRLIDPLGGDPEANARLAEHFRLLDGVSDPEAAVRTTRVVAWLERVHHLGHAGKKGLELLRDITPLSRMSRYELAWSLSFEFEEYELAAEIYRSLAEEKPDDAYSHHYWAWNLDQKGKEFETVWREYKRAIAIEPDNPWFNSRYITFLRDNGFQLEARDAWRESLPIVGLSNWARMPDFAEQFHRWVARSALDAGDLVLAQEVLGSLPSWEVERSVKLSALREELEYLEEIERLGEPFYPLGVSAEKRWKEHYLVPEKIEIPGRTQKASVLAFYPGRVAAIEDGLVTLVLADPKQDPPAIFTVELSETELREIGGGESPYVGRFLELGHYDGDVSRVRYHKMPNEFDRSSFDQSLRHLRRAAPERS